VIQFVDNLLQHSLCIGQHFVIPEPQNSIASLGEKVSPPLIRLNLIGMMSAIQLNDQLRIRAKEVHDVAPNGLLPTKFNAIHLSAPKMQP